MTVVPNPPSQLVDDGDDLVFATRGEVTSSGAVYRLAKAGGTPTSIFRGLSDYPALAIANDGSIVVADSGQASGCRASAGAGSIVRFADNQPPALVSMGRRCVAWLTATPTGIAWVEDVPRRIFGGGDPDPFIGALADNATPQQAPTILRDRAESRTKRDLQRVGDALMWSEDGRIVELSGGAPNVAVTAPGQVDAFAADAADIAYVSKSSLFLRSRVTGAETTLASDVGARQLALDANFVYLVAGALIAVDKQSGLQWPLLDGFGLEGFAQDERFLYVLRTRMHSGPQTEVVRVRKPPVATVMPTGQPRCEMRCDAFGSTCFDLSTDAEHCGDCATACASVESCVAGACVCAPTSRICNGMCVDEAVDAASCGACDRSCQGGTCAGGDCMPVKIGTVANAAVHDAGAIYYALASQIRRFDKQSSDDTLVTQLAEPYDYARYVAQDESRIYIAADRGLFGATNPGAIYSVSKTGASTPTPLYSDRPDPRQIAVTPSAVVWVEDASETVNAPAKLVYAAINGSGILGSFSTAGLYAGSDDDESVGVVAVGSNVYWLLADRNAQSGAIMRVDLLAPSPALGVFASLDVSAYSFTAVGDQLYVTGGWPNGKLLSIPLTGGPPTVHATGLLRPSRVVAAPDGAVLWVDAEGSAIHELAVTAVLPRIVQSGNHVDGTTVLLVDSARLFSVSSYGIYVMQR